MRLVSAQFCARLASAVRQIRPAACCALLAAFALLAAVPPVAAQTSSGLRIIPLPRDEQVFVTVDLTNGFTPDVRAAIQSGLRTVFTFDVELRLDVPGWVDRTIGTATVTNEVEYDNLLRRYTVQRMVDGRQIDSHQTDSEASVRQWLTQIVRVPLFKTSLLEPNREYYLRVRATARPTNGSLLWPFGSGISGMAKFTFIR